MNINEYVKIHEKKGKTTHSGSRWDQHVCEGLLNKENEVTTTERI